MTGSGHLLCRYWWFVVAYEIILIIALLVTTLLKALQRTRMSFIGLLAVAALLTISMTEAFMTAEDIEW